jgi:hypothetical protein
VVAPQLRRGAGEEPALSPVNAKGGAVKRRAIVAWLASTLALLLLFCGAGSASAQECPRSDRNGADTRSPVQSLEGMLVYHDGIRQWFELQLSTPRCGQTSIEIVDPDQVVRALETLRGCRVRSQGRLDFAPTGYYSKDVYQDVRRVEPVGACARQPAFPHRRPARPDRRVRSYVVDMDLDYEPGDHPILFTVRSGGKELRPWQAYASYMLTGGFVLYGQCGKGFVVDRVYGTPDAHPSHFDDPRSSGDMAAYDPENAAQAGKVHMRLGYSCVRVPRRTH